MVDKIVQFQDRMVPNEQDVINVTAIVAGLSSVGEYMFVLKISHEKVGVIWG